MEFLTIFLSSLLAIITPAGLIIDKVVENQLRSQLESVETLEVRIDNVPSYQALEGKIDRVRIASRGVELKKDLRIEALEIETDPINIDFRLIQKEGIKKINQALREPLQGGMRLVLTEADLNRAFASSTIQTRINKIIGQLADGYQINTLQVDLLPDNRVFLKVEINSGGAEENAEKLTVEGEFGIKVISGRKLELVDLTGKINGRTVSSRFLNSMVNNYSQKLDLAKLEEMGIVARLLQLEIDTDEVKVAAFISMDKIKTSDEN